MDIKKVVDDVARSLNDPDFVRWSEEELIDYLNDGCLILCKANPMVNTATAAIKLENGTMQSAGANSLQIIDLHRSITTMRSLRRIDPKLIDTILPLWQQKSPSEDTREFIIDGLVKNRFWVYPPAVGGAMVEATIVRKPDVVGGAVNGLYPEFPLEDEHVGAIKAYMLFRAYSIDTGAGSTQKAEMYMSSFYAAGGIQQRASEDERN